MKIKCIFLSFHDQESLPNTKFTIQNLFTFMNVMFFLVRLAPFMSTISVPISSSSHNVIVAFA